MKAIKTCLIAVFSAALSFHSAYAEEPIALGEGWHINVSQITDKGSTKSVAKESAPTALRSLAPASLSLSSSSNVENDAVALPTVELEELAYGLQYDPLRIFNHLRNHYDYTPYYGYKKGPLQTYLDRAGNDLDIAVLCALLLELSKEHNESIQKVEIVTGEMAIPLLSLQQWLGDLTDGLDAINLMSRAGYSSITESDPVLLPRFLVRLTLDGEYFLIDPAYKIYERSNLNTEAFGDLNFDISDFINAAGGTEGDDWVSNVDSSAAREELDNSVLDLVSVLKSKYDNLSLNELVAIPGIIETTAVSLPVETLFNFSEQSSFTVSTIPEQLCHRFSIEYADINYEVNSADMMGKLVHLDTDPELPLESEATEDLSLTMASLQNNQPIETQASSASSRDTLFLNQDPLSFTYTRYPSFSGNYTATISLTSSSGFIDVSKLGSFSMSAGEPIIFDYTINANELGNHDATITIIQDFGGVTLTNTQSISIVVIEPFLEYAQISSEALLGTSVTEQVTLINTGDQDAIFSNFRLTEGDVEQFFTDSAQSVSVPANSFATFSFDYTAAELYETHIAAITVDFTYGGASGSTTVIVRGSTTRPAALYIDNVEVARQAQSATEQDRELRLVMDSPTTTSRFSQTANHDIKYGGTYAIVNDFGCGGTQKRTNRLLDQFTDTESEEANDAEFRTSLSLLGDAWMRQTGLLFNLVEGLIDDRIHFHHRFGIVAQEEGYYIDVGAQFLFLEKTEPDSSLQEIFTVMASAFEHGIVEQYQENVPGVSTSKLMEMANDQGLKIFRFDQFNKETINDVTSGYEDLNLASNIDADTVFVLTEEAILNYEEWSGQARFSESTSDTGFRSIKATIGGGLNGGESALKAILNSGYLGFNFDLQQTQQAETTITKSAEPVNLQTGDETLDFPGMLRLGNEPSPKGITFSPSYISSRRDNPTGLGIGWDHNWNSSIRVYTEPDFALGLRRPEDAASQLIGALAFLELSKQADTAKNWLLKSIVANWAAERFKNNATSVIVNGDSYTFVNQPDGTFSAPPGVTHKLVKEGDNYRLEGRFGDQWHFAPIGDSTLLTHIEDVHGNTLLVNYNGEKVATVVDAFNRTMSFVYDGDKLVGVNNGLGDSVSFEHNESGAMTAYTTVTGHRYQFTVDGSLITEWIAPTGKIIARNFYSELGRVYEQHSQGNAERVWRFHFEDGLRTCEIDPLEACREFVWDQRKNLIGTIDAEGNATQTTLNSHNAQVETIDPRGNIRKVIYDNNQNPLEVQIFGEGANFDSIKSIFDENHRLIESVDENDNSATFTYNSKHQPLSVTDPEGNVVENIYNSDGTLQKQIDEEGYETSFDYDAWQNTQRVNYPDGTFELFQFSARGDQINHTDQNGNQWSFEYNENRDVITETAPDGSVVTTTYHYSNKPESVTDQNGNTTTNELDVLNNIVSRTDAAGYSVTYNYSLQDVTESVITPLGHSETVVRDLAKREVGSIDPLGREMTLTLDENGNPIFAKNPLGEIVETTFDTENQAISTTNPRDEVVANEFDPAGNRIALTNGRGARFEAQFDSLNREVTRITPEGKTTVTTYTPRGAVESITEASGDVTTFVYGPMGYLVEKTDGVATTTYSYDNNGNILTVTENGETVYYAYDSRNRVIRYEDEDGSVIEYEYDPASNLIAIVYPGDSERRVAYTYTELNQIKTITDWAGNVTTFTWDADGRNTQILYPNGTRRIQKFNAASELVEIRETDAGGFLIYREVNSYDLAGKIIHTATVPATPSLSGLTNQSTSYNLDNELEQHNGQQVLSDLDGNLQKAPISPVSGLIDFTTDARNRLTAVGDFTFSYGITGERKTSVANGKTTKLIVDPNASLSRVLISEDSDGARTFYIYGRGLHYQLSETGELKTYHFDSRGSTMALVATDGLTQNARYHYSPYGDVISAEGEDTLFKYNGRFGVQDDGSGLSYMRARYYSPYLTRFINPDPIGFAGGLNWFAYVSNPISEFDPRGLNAESTSWETRVGDWIANKGLINEAKFIVDSMAGLASNLSMGVSNLFLGDYEPYNEDTFTATENLLIPSLGGIAKKGSRLLATKNIDNFSRSPKGLMDQMVLNSAKEGKGMKIIDDLGDPKFKGMEKWSYSERSNSGYRSEVHYVRNPKNGELMDFKFKHHAETYK